MTQPRTTTPVFAMLLALTAVALVVLPFVSTFDDLLTVIGMKLGIAAPLQWIVPAEVRVTVIVLGLLGIHAGAAGNQLVVWNSSGAPQSQNRHHSEPNQAPPACRAIAIQKPCIEFMRGV